MISTVYDPIADQIRLVEHQEVPTSASFFISSILTVFHLITAMFHVYLLTKSRKLKGHFLLIPDKNLYANISHLVQLNNSNGRDSWDEKSPLDSPSKTGAAVVVVDVVVVDVLVFSASVLVIG